MAVVMEVAAVADIVGMASKTPVRPRAVGVIVGALAMASLHGSTGAQHHHRVRVMRSALACDAGTTCPR